MWCRLVLVAAIMHPRVPPYITQMSDFSKVLSRLQVIGLPEALILPLSRRANRIICTAGWRGWTHVTDAVLESARRCLGPG
jgi:hypothetical protein